MSKNEVKGYAGGGMAMLHRSVGVGWQAPTSSSSAVPQGEGNKKRKRKVGADEDHDGEDEVLQRALEESLNDARGNGDDADDQALQLALALSLNDDNKY